MKKPREFWIKQDSAGCGNDFVDTTPGAFEGLIHVREVVEIDWEKVYAVLKINNGIELLKEDKKALQQLVEEQLSPKSTEGR